MRDVLGEIREIISRNMQCNHPPDDGGDSCDGADCIFCSVMQALDSAPTTAGAEMLADMERLRHSDSNSARIALDLSAEVKRLKDENAELRLFNDRTWDELEKRGWAKMSPSPGVRSLVAESKFIPEVEVVKLRARVQELEKELNARGGY